MIAWPGKATWVCALAAAILLAGAHGARAAQPAHGPEGFLAGELAGLSPEEIVREQVEQLGLEPLRSFVETLDPAVRESLPPLDPSAIIFGGEGIPWAELGRRAVRELAGEVALNASLLGQLIVLGVFCAFLRVIASSLAGSEATEVAFMVSLLVLLLLGFGAFRAALAAASATLDQMVDLMHAVLPLLSTMLAAVGAVTTAAVFHPLLYVTVTTVATLVRGVLFPLVMAGAALAVIGSAGGEFPARRMAKLVRTSAVTLLGLAFIAFFAVLKARGAIAPVADGVALRTARFLTGTFIPVVGGRVADALDVVVGGSMLIKNAVGLFGMGAVAAVTAIPLMKVFSIFFIFRLAAALVEPVTDPRLADAMAGLADSLGLLLAGMVTAGLMFFVGITVVVSVGNAAAAMR